jgi:hypothetical protein
MCCPSCGRRGMTYNAYHDAAGRYRVLAVCPRCGAGEEI